MFLHKYISRQGCVVLYQNCATSQITECGTVVSLIVDGIDESDLL